MVNPLINSLFSQAITQQQPTEKMSGASAAQFLDTQPVRANTGKTGASGQKQGVLGGLTSLFRDPVGQSVVLNLAAMNTPKDSPAAQALKMMQQNVQSEAYKRVLKDPEDPSGSILDPAMRADIERTRMQKEQAKEASRLAEERIGVSRKQLELSRERFQFDKESYTPEYQKQMNEANLNLLLAKTDGVKKHNEFQQSQYDNIQKESELTITRLGQEVGAGELQSVIDILKAARGTNEFGEQTVNYGIINGMQRAYSGTPIGDTLGKITQGGSLSEMDSSGSGTGFITGTGAEPKAPNSQSAETQETSASAPAAKREYSNPFGVKNISQVYINSFVQGIGKKASIKKDAEMLQAVDQDLVRVIRDEKSRTWNLYIQNPETGELRYYSPYLEYMN